MDKHKLNNFFDYSLEPRRAILFEDVKSNYASIECVQRNLNPLTTSLCVMSRADNTKGLTLASSPTFKKVFGMKNISRASDLPFIIETRKFNFPQWYRTQRIFTDNGLNQLCSMSLSSNPGQNEHGLFRLKCSSM
jgi:DNA polymerase V